MSSGNWVRHGDSAEDEAGIQAAMALASDKTDERFVDSQANASTPDDEEASRHEDFG
jgi:hypothetical protein